MMPLAYLVTLVVFVAIDLVWLGVVAHGYYRERIGALLLAEPQLGAAAAFYLLYAAGVVYFAVMPGLDAGSPMKAAQQGAVLGFIAYATYDLTNLATLKGWSLSLAVVDMAWGTVLTGAVAAITVWALGLVAR
ncbi:MAG: DUF2177 family protein [Hyphomicrobiaceae bacterium]